MDISLYMFKNNGEPKVFKITAGKTLIGRGEDCELRIPLGEISRRHAELTVDEENAIIRDLGSVNGTYVNNRRITEQTLEPGDHIIMGPVVFTVQINGEPSKIRKVKTRLETKQPAAGSGRDNMPEPAAVGAEDSGFDIGENDDDPISALEALASSDADATAEIDIDGSHIDLDLDDSKA